MFPPWGDSASPSSCPPPAPALLPLPNLVLIGQPVCACHFSSPPPAGPLAPASPTGAVGLVLASGHGVVLFVSCVSALFGTAAHLIRSVHTCAVGPIILELPSLLLLFSLPCGFYLPPFAPIWPIGLAPFLLLLFPCIVASTCNHSRLFGPRGCRLSFSCSSPCLVGFICHHSRLFGPWGWRLSFSCSSPALWLLFATTRAYLAHAPGAFPSPALLPACCGFYLSPFAPIWPMGAGAFPSHVFLPACCGFLLATIRAYSAHGAGAFWRLSFSCFSPCLLWLLLATIRAYLAPGAGAFPSHVFLPACCGFYLPPFAPMWPMGLAPFLLLLFSLLVVAFVCHHSRLFVPLGWHLSFSCSSPALWLLLATIRAFSWGWRLSFSCSSPCLLWPLLATIRAYVAHGAGAFPSPALLPACCGFYLPPFAPMWPMGLVPFLLMLFPCVVAFVCHLSRRLSFSCFSPFLLWLFLATICAYLAHWAGAFPSHAFLPACCGFLLATICAYFAPGAGAFPSPALLPACCGFYLPPLAPIWPMGLAPFLLLLFSLLVVAFACHHSRLFGPLGWRPVLLLLFSRLVVLLLATIRAYLAHWAGAFPSPALLPACCAFSLATIRAYLAHGAGAFPSHALLSACCGFCLPPFAPIWPMGLAPFLLLLFSLPCGLYLPPLAPIWPMWLPPFLLLLFSLLVVAFYLPPFAPIWPMGLAPFLLLLFSLLVVAFYLPQFAPIWSMRAGAFSSPALLPACCGFCLPPFAPIWPPGLAPFLLLLFSLFVAHGAGAFPSPAVLPACCGFCLPPFAPIWPMKLAPFLLLLFSLIAVAFACHHSRLFGPRGWRLFFSALLPACCGFCLPPFAPIWPMHLVPFLLLLFSLLVVAFTCHHSRLFGPWGLAPFLLMFFSLLVVAFYLPPFAPIRPMGLAPFGAFPSLAFLRACCGFFLPPCAPVWPMGLAPFLLMLFSLLVVASAGSFAAIWPTGLVPFLLIMWPTGLAPVLLLLSPLLCQAAFVPLFALTVLLPGLVRTFVLVFLILAALPVSHFSFMFLA